jgi:arginyl-tRNA synthetase
MRQSVHSLITQTLNELRVQGVLVFDSVAPFSVEVPRAAKGGEVPRGDWSSNVAMVMSKATGKKPPELAQLVADAITKTASALVSRVEVINNFLNFTLKQQAYSQVVREVLSQGTNFGRQAPSSSGKKMLVEFVSANPTGPVHIGHARGAFMGDAVARLLDAAGHTVTREFYINDFGKQVETLGRTVYKRYRETFGEAITLAEGEYPAEYVKDIAKAWRARDGEKYLLAPESEWLPVAMAIGIDLNLEGIRASLAKANIRHDNFFSEASLHASGAVRQIVDRYRELGATYEATEARRSDEKVRNQESKAAQYADRQQGGTFLQTSKWKEDKTIKQAKYKDDEDRIIMRADGTPVYLTADLAYHRHKFERKFDRMIDVFGADHSGHLARIATGMKLLDYDAERLDFVVVQIVRIVRDGEEVRVSKRKGTVYELADLIEEAGADVCRFIFLMKTANAQFDFDLNDVAKQSKDNPVFYFQMGHARCAAILRKAVERGVPFKPEALTESQLALLELPEEKAMLKKMSLLPDVVLAASEKLEPHHVLYFCQELIADFHSYYTQYRADPIVSDDKEKTQGRLAMVAALKQTLQSAFGILGIAAPEVMTAPPDDE